MDNVVKLKDLKRINTLKKLVRDLEGIIKVLELTQRGLILFKNYIAVQRIISVIETEKNLLFINMKKCNKELETQNGQKS